MASFLFFLAGGQLCKAQDANWINWATDPVQQTADWTSFADKVERKKYLDSLSQSFQNLGYLSLFLEKEEISTDSLIVRLILGEKYGWESISPGNVPEEFFRNISPVTAEYTSAARWMREVISKAENNGFPFAQVKLDSILRKGNFLSAVFRYDSGPLILWDSLKVAGDTKTQERYVQNITGIRPGLPFSQKQLDVASEVLARSAYFVQTEPPRLDFQVKKAQPTFTLRDRNTNVLDGVIGLLPNENEPGKMLITGQLDVELYHLGGKGRDVALHWKRLNIATQSLDISAKESFLFNSPLDVSVGFSLLKQDSTFLNRHLSLDFGYHLSQTSYLRFFTRRQSSDVLDTEAYDAMTELPDVADYRWNQYGVGWSWDRRDSPFFSRRGFLLSSEFALGNKRILENTGFPPEVYENLDLSSPQYLGMMDIEKHIYIKPTWGMWLKGSGGFTQNQNLLLNDLFRLGGLKSIRGFNENYFFAKSYGYLSMEQRLFFGENSFLMVFADFGILENPYFAASIDKPVSFGAGINLDTGTGNFRFIYGVGKSNLQPLQFSYSRIHFGYLARF
ncbi:Outer membrane protein assembly factor BamA [Algoriphagus locisalis]|uniref:Outer membrane protein assembly factor BamA n=1 Tax=Algoriphagus locisalis TaxID=305507 RepID=A0A1I7CUP6_9BACT|nr:BamA/TamA family outer membrane protein [Algoriphagus locisalis]SFU03165.1 Outer membrane protein assembly factor BamA [Algoriphagus locisalis]